MGKDVRFTCFSAMSFFNHVPTALDLWVCVRIIYNVGTGYKTVTQGWDNSVG